MEALSAFEAEQKRHRRWVDSLGQQIREAARNVTSPTSPLLVSALEQARVNANVLFEEFKARLFRSLEFLGSAAELIHPTPKALQGSRSDVLIEEPTDNLILVCVLGHSKNHPSEAKILLSENRRDFDTNLGARLALRGSGVRYFADASKCLQWHRAHPEP